MEFKNIKELNKWINNQAKKAMKTDVAPMVVQKVKEHIIKDTYDTYTPRVYKRQMDDGGLLDDENIEVTEIENGIKVRNIRSDEETGKYVAYTVETGKGYDFPTNVGPRPFTENTRREILEKGLHKKALKNGLKKLGINTD